MEQFPFDLSMLKMFLGPEQIDAVGDAIGNELEAGGISSVAISWDSGSVAEVSPQRLMQGLFTWLVNAGDEPDPNFVEEVFSEIAAKTG
jgi:hypothetical protein